MAPSCPSLWIFVLFNHISDRHLKRIVPFDWELRSSSLNLYCLAIGSTAPRPRLQFLPSPTNFSAYQLVFYCRDVMCCHLPFGMKTVKMHTSPCCRHLFSFVKEAESGGPIEKACFPQRFPKDRGTWLWEREVSTGHERFSQPTTRYLFSNPFG